MNKSWFGSIWRNGLFARRVLWKLIVGTTAARISGVRIETSPTVQEHSPCPISFIRCPMPTSCRIRTASSARYTPLGSSVTQSSFSRMIDWLVRISLDGNGRFYLTLIFCFASDSPRTRPDGPAPTITTGAFSMPELASEVGIVNDRKWWREELGRNSQGRVPAGNNLSLWSSNSSPISRLQNIGGCCLREAEISIVPQDQNMCPTKV